MLWTKTFADPRRHDSVPRGSGGCDTIVNVDERENVTGIVSKDKHPGHMGLHDENEDCAGGATRIGEWLPNVHRHPHSRFRVLVHGCGCGRGRGYGRGCVVVDGSQQPVRDAVGPCRP